MNHTPRRFHEHKWTASRLFWVWHKQSLIRWNYRQWPSTTCLTSQPLLWHERHCSGSCRWQKLAIHMHLCILPSSPTSVFVQDTWLKNGDPSWDRDWKGQVALKPGYEELWRTVHSLSGLTASFLDPGRLPLWMILVLQDPLGADGQDIDWMSFGSSSSVKRFETELFPIPRTDDPSVSGRGTKLDFFWVAARCSYMVSNLDSMTMVKL